MLLSLCACITVSLHFACKSLPPSSLPSLQHPAVSRLASLIKGLPLSLFPSPFHHHVGHFHSDVFCHYRPGYLILHHIYAVEAPALRSVTDGCQPSRGTAYVSVCLSHLLPRSQQGFGWEFWLPDHSKTWYEAPPWLKTMFTLWVASMASLSCSRTFLEKG